MKLKKSLLEFVDFKILKSDYQLVPIEDDNSESELTEDYSIDLDFMIRKPEDNSIVIFTKVSINREEINIPGHSIFAEAVSVFQLSKSQKEMTQNEIDNVIIYSAVNIAFNHLRGHIRNITSFTYPGSYTIPIFDLNDLVRQKNERLENLKKEELTNKPKIKNDLKEQDQVRKSKKKNM